MPIARLFASRRADAAVRRTWGRSKAGKEGGDKKCAGKTRSYKGACPGASKGSGQ